GNQLAVRDPKGRQTTYTYDAFNRQTSRKLPGGEVERTEYDALGRPFRKIDFKGQIHESTYDALGRAVTEKLYDNAAQLAAGTPHLVITSTYDDLGRLQTVTAPRRGPVRYDYNADGKPAKVTTPEGVVEYEYDARTGRLERTFTAFTDVRYT